MEKIPQIECPQQGGTLYTLKQNLTYHHIYNWNEKWWLTCIIPMSRRHVLLSS